jgi:hypothetical protein
LSAVHGVDFAATPPPPSLFHLIVAIGDARDA